MLADCFAVGLEPSTSELGHQLKPHPLRSHPSSPPPLQNPPETEEKRAPVQGHGAPTVALPWKVGTLLGTRFHAPARRRAAVSSRQNVASPRSSAGKPDGSLRVLLQRQNPRLSPLPIAPTNASGMGTPRPNPVGSVSCSIRFKLAPRRYSGWIGVAESTDDAWFSTSYENRTESR